MISILRCNIIFNCDDLPGQNNRKLLHGYVKAGYKILDPSEGHMLCDVIFWVEMTHKQHEYIGNKLGVLHILPFWKECKCLTLRKES